MRTCRIVQIRGIDVHPDPEVERLVILRLNIAVDLVAGLHYEEGQLGIYIPAGAYIPGWLAEDSWLVKKGVQWTKIEERIMKGVNSPGLFVGHHWRNSPTSEWQDWPLWRKRWKLGEDVTGYLGVRFL